MSSDGTVLGVTIAVVGGLCSVLVAIISTPRGRTRDSAEGDAPGLDGPPSGLQVSPEIWQYVSARFATLEGKVDNLTLLVETKKAEVSALEHLLRTAMRIIRRANRRLVAKGESAEEVDRELVPYSID